MLENNYEYLAKQLEQIGYNENLHLGLLNQIMTNSSQFSIKHKINFGQDVASVSMQFGKPQDSGLHSFKNYIIEVKKGNNSETQKQTFHIEGQDLITLKEAYNLLQGRAVNKELNTIEGNKYTAWIQLDFKNTDKDGSFILKKLYQNDEFYLAATLDRHPIKELQDVDERKKLLESLKSGNRQPVTYVQNGVEKKAFIEAAPQFRYIHIYDADMKRLKPEHLFNGQEAISVNQTYKNQFKRNISGGANDTPTQQKANRSKSCKHP